jgi:hypothetical protein
MIRNFNGRELYCFTGGLKFLLSESTGFIINDCPIAVSVENHQSRNVGQRQTIVCLNSKFPPPVELCWQNKSISKLGILITKVGNIIIL